ncbi:methyltransferase type 11 [Candidatus Poribacteria bacterium]|nr:methyltransferase type 11 [Candidatus Poribacteria bacterium]
MARHEFDADRYAAASTHQTEWGHRLIAELDIAGDEHVLDIGCGDGRLTGQLAQLVPRGRVLGIDASSRMIDAAQSSGARNCEFRVLDAARLDMPGEFDLIFSNAALHWVKDHGRLLRASFDALRPDGVIRFNFAADGNCSHLIGVVRELMADPAHAEGFEAFEWPWFMPAPDEYEALVRAHPFRDARVWGENADRDFPSVEDMVRWIDQPSLVPFLSHLPTAARQPFRDVVVERMIVCAGRDDGTCFETFRRVNVLATK